MESPEDAKRGLIPWLRSRVAQSATRAVERMDGEPEVALESAQTTLSWSLRHRGPDSPLTVEAKREVAELLERTGRLDEALQLRSEIATSLRIQLGVDDARTLIAEEFQGFILERLGRPAEALPHFEHVLSVRTEVLGRDDLATLLAMDRLGCVYRGLGNLEESRRLLQEAVDRFQSNGAGETEECTRTMSHLATTLFQLERVSESCDLRKHIFELRNRLLGSDDPATVSSLQSLVDMLRWMGDLDATAIYQKLLDERAPPVGDGHGDARGRANEISVPSITRRVGQPNDELIDLLTGRPGWHLETSLTPGAPPLWGFRSGGKIEFSVATDGHSIRLYVRDTGAEIVFDHADELAAWLSANRPAALLEPSAVPTVRARLRKFGEWS